MEINSLLIIHGLLLILGALILSLLISIIFVYVPEVIITRISKKRSNRSRGER